MFHFVRNECSTSPEYADWDVTPKACGPYRARTKGKTESGVKYVKRNALAGRDFESFAALQKHLVEWMAEADARVHGTTHELHEVFNEQYPACYDGKSPWNTVGPDLPYTDN
ncbi:hypothetical protein BON30_48585 [Cystobacter ferrugineus]|uniref:Transposase n=1 Tax=Cystobacter ferrugineus TaxID=83449 RepID=A0A1L9ATV3_9BACT|nr:hypothetical protein BON30_48585 [Cystobacter ferrugineus]